MTRAVFTILAVGFLAAALAPGHQAQAWWDRWGRWHPDVYRPPVVYAPPPRPYYAAPYARWVPPHYNRWGRFVPGHWA